MFPARSAIKGRIGFNPSGNFDFVSSEDRSNQTVTNSSFISLSLISLSADFSDGGRSPSFPN